MTALLPSTIQAVFFDTPTTPVVRTVPTPSPSPTQILVCVAYVGLNPADAKFGTAGALVGFDFSGTVVGLGSDVTKFGVGDRVAGMIFGNTAPDSGAAAEVIVADVDFLFKVPDTISLADAVTHSASASTAATALYYELGHGVPAPPGKVAAEDGNAPWLLVTAGASTVGLYTIQFAKRAGFRVVTTASPHSFDLVRRYGADVVVPYADADAAIAKIKEVTGGKLHKAIEVAGGDSWSIPLKTVTDGTIVTVVFPGDLPAPPGVEVRFITLMAAFPKAPAFIGFNPALHDYVESFYASVPEIAAAGIRPVPIEVREGLVSIVKGLDDLRANNVRGKKLVVKV